MPTFDHYDQGTPSWIELMTPDPLAAAEFYATLFGWGMEEHQVDDQGTLYRIGQIDGDDVAGLSGQMPGMEGHPAFWGVYLAVDDVDAAAAKVESAGGTVSAPPFDVMELGRMAAIVDPTGARVNLWQARDSVGTQRANEPGTPIFNEVVTPDPERAAAFYADALGMGSESHEMNGQSYTILTSSGRPVAGATKPQLEGLPPHWNVYFNVADVDVAVATAEKGGASVMVPAFDAPGVGRMAFLADPQGAGFAVMAAASENAPASDDATAGL